MAHSAVRIKSKAAEYWWSDSGSRLGVDAVEDGENGTEELKGEVEVGVQVEVEAESLSACLRMPRVAAWVAICSHRISAWTDTGNAG